MSGRPRRLEDAADPALGCFAGLTRRSGPADPVVIEGETFVRRAVEAGHRLHTLVTTPSRSARCAALGERAEVWLEVEADVLEVAVGFAFHRGVLAALPRPQPSSASLAGPVVRIAVLAGLADPANVGAVVRNARAFGVDLVVFDRGGADPFNRKAIRASAGYVFSQPWQEAVDVASAVTRLRQEVPGLRVCAASVGDAVTPWSAYEIPSRWLLLLGNEGHGLPAPLLELADDRVCIEMGAGVDSLNVAAASAILLHAGRRAAST